MNFQRHLAIALMLASVIQTPGQKADADGKAGPEVIDVDRVVNESANKFKYYASGLNWQMNKTSAGHRRIWQNGGSFGFSSYCAVFPELRLGIVLLANESDRDSQGRLNAMADDILRGLGGN